MRNDLKLLGYIDSLDRCGFGIWAVNARTRLSRESDYDPMQEIKWSDRSIAMFSNNDYSWWKR